MNKKKTCSFCGYVPENDRGALNREHIYCIGCRKIIHFNVHLPSRHCGHCSCGWTVEETKRGAAVWSHPTRPDIVFPEDEMFAWK